MKKDKTIILRVDENQKSLLAGIAAVTQKNESAVLRELIMIGGEIVTREILRNQNEGKTGPIQLALATDKKGEFMQFLGVVAGVLLEHGKRQAVDDIFAGFFPDGLGDRKLAPTEIRLEVLNEAAQDFIARGSKNAK